MMENPEISRHAVEQFALSRFGHEKLQHEEEYYLKLIRYYFKESKLYQLPKHIQVSKRLKYGDEMSTTYYVNWLEKLLFTLVGNKIITVFFPYGGSKRSKSMYGKKKPR